MSCEFQFVYVFAYVDLKIFLFVIFVVFSGQHRPHFSKARAPRALAPRDLWRLGAPIAFNSRHVRRKHDQEKGREGLVDGGKGGRVGLNSEE